MYFHLLHILSLLDVIILLDILQMITNITVRSLKRHDEINDGMTTTDLENCRKSKIIHELCFTGSSEELQLSVL